MVNSDTNDRTPRIRNERTVRILQFAKKKKKKKQFLTKQKQKQKNTASIADFGVIPWG